MANKYEFLSNEYDAVITRGTGNNTTTGHTEAVYSNNGSLLKINGSEFNPLNVSRIMVIEGNQLVKIESIAGAPSDSNYTLFLMGENNVYTPIIMHNNILFLKSLFIQFHPQL